MPAWLPLFGQCVDGGLERSPIDDVGIELFWPPEAHIFMFRMGRVADGIEVVGIPGRTSNILWRAAADGIEQEWKTVRWRVVEPFFELDHMVPAVAEVIEIMDRLGAGLLNDIAEPRLASIDGLGAKITIGIRDAPMFFASEELEEMAIRPAKRRLKRQMQPIKTQGHRYDEALPIPR